MIATIHLPGGSCFAWKRLTTRGHTAAHEARQWRRRWLARHGETEETLNAIRQGAFYTERDAARARYLDGSRIFADGTEDDS